MHLTLPDKNIISITHLEQIMDQYPWNQNKSIPPGPSPNSVSKWKKLYIKMYNRGISFSIILICFHVKVCKICYKSFKTLIPIV